MSNDVGNFSGDSKHTLEQIELVVPTGSAFAAGDAAALKADAVAGIHLEKRMKLWESIKTYRAACVWSMIASLSIIMESYVTCLRSARNPD